MTKFLKTEHTSRKLINRIFEILQSAKSNTLLLTAANLAAFKFDKVKPHHDYVPPQTKNYDTESLASSTHFTLVNGMERKLPKHMKPVECCCEKHQLSILITTMTIFLAVTIFLCIYFFQCEYILFKVQ